MGTIDRFSSTYFFSSGTAMIPDDEGAEHLVRAVGSTVLQFLVFTSKIVLCMTQLGAPSFSTGSRFGASGASTVSISEEPAHKMVRRQEPVDVQPAVQWQNSFGSQKADDGWSFQSLS